MSTIQEVALRAGVSAGSVSRYLNGYQLKPRNEEAIEQAIHDLDYHPNFLARSLRKSKSMSIGLLVNNMLNHFATGVIAQIENELELFDYSIILSGFRNDERVFGDKLQMMLGRRVDGLFVFQGTSSYKGLSVLDSATIPVIALGAPLNRDGVDTIMVNDYQSSYDVIAQMLACGHERIGIITGKQNENVTRERLRGALEAFDSAGVPRSQAQIIETDYSVRSGYKAMCELLDVYHLDTIYVSNYGTGQGALQAIAERGLRIGEHISYATHDYFEMSTLFYPRITTIYSPSVEMGSCAARHMMQLIDSGSLLTGTTHILDNTVQWRPSILGLPDDMMSE